jgi:Type VI secretion system (T6SS), amidase effector protein 4
MSKPLVQQAKVKTNTVKDSVCKIDVPVVKFSDLWNNYVTGSPYKPGPNEGDYGNQCALRMSATFHKVGIQMKSFSQKIVKPMPGAKVLGRVIMNGLPAASRAYELGEWLKLQPFCGLPKQPETITGKDWESKVRGRTGIIMFHAYWARDTDSSGQASGGHIDLWNGNRLTNNGIIGTLETFARFTLGIHRPWPHVYSDLRDSKKIMFFEIK